MRDNVEDALEATLLEKDKALKAIYQKGYKQKTTGEINHAVAEMQDAYRKFKKYKMEKYKSPYV